MEQKCNKTISGKHDWIASLRYKSDNDSAGYYHYWRPKCFACGIINDNIGVHTDRSIGQDEVDANMLILEEMESGNKK